ncbi:MAG: M1 family metallopeptidase, partial [Deltaproteobacteria bacterium]|nr:M1 family metallopeptidase [Deltaproteobacteria bacterium]
FGWFPQERYRDPAGQGWSTGDVLSGFRYRLDLALPARLQAAVGADWCEERLQGEQRIVRCGSQVPVRSIPLLLSDRWVRRTARADGIEITVLAQPDGDIFDRSATEAETFLQLVRGMLAFFGKSYGPYRLRRLIIAETPVSGMSMAADGMLLLTDLFWIYNATWLAWGIFDPVAEATLAHELAHLWWGIGVGADLDRHNWLSEAFAQYLSFRWMTSAHGARADTGLRPNGFVRWLVGSTSEIKLPRRQVEEQILPDYRYLVEDGRDGKISEPMARQKDLATLEALYYEKGYLVLRALELFMPEPTVRQVLREVHRRYAGEVATIDDFQRVAEEVSGVELDRLFAGWVHGTASGDYAVEDLKVFKIKSGGYRSRIAVRYRGSGALPVPLLVTDEEQRETVVIWDPVEGAGEVEVDTAAFPETIALDPQGLAPDTMRRNNFYPRQSTFSWLLARNDPEAYVVSLKPTRFSSFGTIGPAIGGNYLDDHQWWIGAGLGGSTGPLGDDDGSGESSGAGGEASDELATRLGAYAESAWRLSRSHALTAGAGASTAASGKARRYDAQGLLGWQYTRFSSPELGLSAPLLLPVLQLLVGAGPHWTRDEGSEPQEVASGELSLALLRDDTPTLGLSQRLSLTGGGYARDGLRRYGIARYDLAHLASLGRPSYLATQLAAGVQSSSTPSSWRFVPDLSPAAMVVGDPPRGAWMAQGSLRYTLPLLRQLR